MQHTTLVNFKDIHAVGQFEGCKVNAHSFTGFEMKRFNFIAENIIQHYSDFTKWLFRKRDGYKAACRVWKQTHGRCLGFGPGHGKDNKNSE